MAHQDWNHAHRKPDPREVSRGAESSRTPKRTVALQLSLPPGLPVLEDAQRFIAVFARTRFSNRIAERVTLASYELLANALDYGRVTTDVHYELMIGEDDVVVRVTNSAVGARLDMLRKHVARLDDNAARIYESELTRSLDGAGARAMLGLARLRHEAGMQLALTTELDRVTVEASCRR